MNDVLRKSIIIFILSILALVCIVPLILVISVSLTSQESLYAVGYSLIPQEWTFEAYKMIFEEPAKIINAYKITVFVSVVGTIIGLTVSSMLGYVLTRKDYKLIKFTSIVVFLPLIFNVIFVPWYILIARYLHLKDTVWVLIVPYLVVPWFVLLLKGFISTVPTSLIESAKIDGASEFFIFTNIIVPLSKAGLATVGLFYMLMFWNDYRLSLFFIEDENKVSIQYLLYRIMSNVDFLNSALASESGVTSGIKDVPSQTMRMAMGVISAGPILFIFPFFQKYFVKGMTLGSVKG